MYEHAQEKKIQLKFWFIVLHRQNLLQVLPYFYDVAWFEFQETAEKF